MCRGWGFSWAVLMGDMRIVCWPRRWASKEGSREEEREGMRVREARKEERRKGEGVEGRSSRSMFD